MTDPGWRGVGFGVVPLLLIFEFREVRHPHAHVQEKWVVPWERPAGDRLGVLAGVYQYPAEQKSGEEAAGVTDSMGKVAVSVRRRLHTGECRRAAGARESPWRPRE